MNFRIFPPPRHPPPSPSSFLVRFCLCLFCFFSSPPASLSSFTDWLSAQTVSRAKKKKSEQHGQGLLDESNQKSRVWDQKTAKPKATAKPAAPKAKGRVAGKVKEGSKGKLREVEEGEELEEPEESEEPEVEQEDGTQGLDHGNEDIKR